MDTQIANLEFDSDALAVHPFQDQTSDATPFYDPTTPRPYWSKVIPLEKFSSENDQPAEYQQLKPGMPPEQTGNIPPPSGMNRPLPINQLSDPTASDSQSASPLNSASGQLPSAPRLIHSELEDLPIEMRERIIEIVERNSYEITTQIVLAPPPEGLGLKTSKSALYRFVQRYHRGQLKTQREQAAREAAEIAASADSPATLVAATSHLLRHRLLTLVNADVDPNTILKYVRALDVLASTDQSERRLRLAESKFAAGK